jgi:uncharacterized protein (DUF433 family)
MTGATLKNRNNDPKPGLTPLETAWVTDLSPKTVNASLDRGEVKPRRPRRGPGRTSAGSRTLGPAEVIYLALRRDVGSALSPEARRELYAELVELTRKMWPEWSSASTDRSCNAELALAGGAVRVDITQACVRVLDRWNALRAANQLVISDPDIRSGEPVIRGTRIPVYLIAELVQQGVPMKEIAEDFPVLSTGQIQAALAYALTRPRRGRPRKAPWRE